MGSSAKTKSLYPCCFNISNDQSPTQFLSLINNAEYIITNSFHGMVFSVLLEKQFIVYKNDLVRYLREFIKLLQESVFANISQIFLYSAFLLLTFPFDSAI